MKVSIDSVYDYSVNTDTKLFNSPLLNQYIIDYEEHYKNYDLIFANTYHKVFFVLLPFTKSTIEGVIFQNFNTLFHSFLLEHKWEFDGLKELEDAEFNPLENYNMTEHEEAERKPNLSYESNSDIHRGNTHTHSTTDTTPDSQEVTTEKQRVPYDLKEYVATDKDITSNTIKSNRKDVTDSITDTIHDTNSSSSTEKGNEDTTRTLTRSGNIGVTTSQQMWMSQKELLNFSLFDYITRKFVEQYCVYDDCMDWNDCMGGVGTW